MKRDMNLVREILRTVENSDAEPGEWITIELPGRSSKEISYHVMLLEQSGLIEAIDLSTKSGFEWKATGLTWRGHEFLDAARSDTIWQKAMDKVGKVAESVSIDVLTGVLKKTASDLLGLTD